MENPKKYNKMLLLSGVHCQNCSLSIDLMQGPERILVETDAQLATRAEVIHAEAIVYSRQLCASTRLVINYSWVLIDVRTQTEDDEKMLDNGAASSIILP